MTRLDDSLHSLRAAGLIRPVFSEAEPASFAFRHSLSHQTAYGSLLRKDREGIHKVVGGVLERLQPENLQDMAPSLAEHFLQAGEKVKALAYLEMAGDGAGRIYAHSEAISFYERAMGLANELGADEATFIRLYSRRGRMLELAGEHARALETYLDMESTGVRLGLTRLELGGLTRQVTLKVSPTSVADPEAGRVLANRVLEKARLAGDAEAEARAHWSLLLVSVFMSDQPDSVLHGERALELARSLDDQELVAFVLNDLSTVYMLEGNPTRAFQVLSEARTMWQEMGNLPMLVDTIVNTATVHFAAGELDQGLAIAREAQELAQQIDNRWAQSYSMFMTDYAFAEKGEFDKAFALSHEQIRLGREVGFVMPEVFSQALVAWFLVNLGDPAQGLDLALNAQAAIPVSSSIWTWVSAATAALAQLRLGETASAQEQLRTLEEHTRGAKVSQFFPGYALYPMAKVELGLATGHPEEGLSLLERVCTENEESGLGFFLADAFHLLGDAYMALNQRDKAVEALERGLAVARKMGSLRTEWAIRADLADQLDTGGDIDQAQFHRREARRILAFILDHLGNDSLKSKFIATARARRLLKDETLAP